MSKEGIAIGDSAPEWKLKTIDGLNITLSQYRGKAVVLFFFRGTWCPTCRKQMEQIRDKFDVLSGLAQIIGIAGQGEKETREYLARNPLPYLLLPDLNREVIKNYGVYQLLGLNGVNIAYPSTIIVDREGIVRYCYVGGQFDRPDLEEVINHLQKLPNLANQS